MSKQKCQINFQCQNNKLNFLKDVFDIGHSFDIRPWSLDVTHFALVLLNLRDLRDLRVLRDK